jgi:hypothetical protein
LIYLFLNISVNLCKPASGQVEFRTSSCAELLTKKLT